MYTLMLIYVVLLQELQTWYITKYTTVFVFHTCKQKKTSYIHVLYVKVFLHDFSGGQMQKIYLGVPRHYSALTVDTMLQ